MSNNNLYAGGASEDDFKGVGDWTSWGHISANATNGSLPTERYPNHPSSSFHPQHFNALPAQYNTPLFAANRYQQPLQAAPGVYASPPLQGHPSYYATLPTSSVDPARSYAAVVARGPRSAVTPNYAPPEQMLNHQQFLRPQTTQRSVGGVPTSGHALQNHPARQRSWAQIAAMSQGQAFHSNPTYNGSASGPSIGQHLASRQYFRPATSQLPYNTPNHVNYLDDIPSGNWQGSNAMDETWLPDPDMDFPLFDEPMDRYIEQPGPYFPKAGVVVNTSPTGPAIVTPSQLLKSPVPSIDASSVSSSARRSKKEIMEGCSGIFKCKHCGGGFNSPDDRRHHEHRVHMRPSDRPFVCPKCSKSFVHEKDLKRHLPTHEGRATNAKYFCHYTGCEYTSLGFARKDHYKRHMRSHYKADSGIQMSRSTSAGTFS